MYVSILGTQYFKLVYFFLGIDYKIKTIKYKEKSIELCIW